MGLWFLVRGKFQKIPKFMNLSESLDLWQQFLRKVNLLPHRPKALLTPVSDCARARTQAYARVHARAQSTRCESTQSSGTSPAVRLSCPAHSCTRCQGRLSHSWDWSCWQAQRWHRDSAWWYSPSPFWSGSSAHWEIIYKISDARAPGKMPVELILDNSAGPKSVRVGQVRVGKRRISLLVRTNQNIAFVPEKLIKFLTKGFQRNQCYLQHVQDVAVHHSHPPKNDCWSKKNGIRDQWIWADPKIPKIETGQLHF